MLFKLTLIMFYLFFFYSMSSAAGAPDYQPDNPHPRIWLSPAVKSTLQAKVSENTPEWQALKGWCDTNLGTNLPEGYQGLSWRAYLLSYALCYQMTGVDAYGNQGVVYLKALLYDDVRSGPVGSGGGGAESIQVDSGYVARSIGAGAALGRDWLDGAPDLDPSTIALVNQRLGEWISWYNSSGYAKDSPTDNYYAGYFAMVYLAGLGLYGDVGYDSTWLSQAEEMWSSDVLPLLNGNLDGGDWLEGWNYGPWAAREYMQYPLALETAAGDTSAWSETDWHEDLVKSAIHMLHPSRMLMSDDGSWSGDASKKGWPALRINAAFLAEATPISAELKGLARWYENNLVNVQGAPSFWEAFLWLDPSADQAPPTVGNMGLYHSMGLGHMVARSSWDVNATFVDMIGRRQDNYNPGEIKIASRGVPLLVDADTYQLSGSLANVPMISGGHTYAPYPEPWHSEVNVISEENSAYFYRKVENLEKAYDGPDWSTPNPSTSHNTRQTLFLRPDLVVNYDNIILMDATQNKVSLQWNFMGNPDISGNKITLTNGSGKLFVTTLGHPVTQTKSLTTAGRNNVYKVEIDVADDPLINQLITVFETAEGTSMTRCDPVVIKDINGHMKGLFIQSETDPNKNWVLLFTSDPYDNNVTDDIIYELPVPPGYGFWPGYTPSHLLVNLQPNTEFTFIAPKNKNESPQVFTLKAGAFPDEGRVYTSSSRGVIYIAPPGNKQKMIQ